LESLPMSGSLAVKDARERMSLEQAFEHLAS
jgi:hypothetical protein